LQGGDRIDPSRLNPVTLNFLKHVPVSNDPCGRLQYGIPNSSTEHQALGKVDYTINANQSLFARYFYTVYDSHLRRQQRADAQPSPRQNNQAHSLVVGHNLGSRHDTQLAAHHLQPHVERSSAAVVFQRHRPGSRVSASARYVGVSVTGNACRRLGRRNRATSTRRDGRSPTTSI
jgi:hypothetical protein